MNCKKVKSLYTEYSDGSLNKISEKEVLSHLKVCNKCRRLYKYLDRVTSYSGTYEDLRPVSDIIEKTLERIATIPQSIRFLKPRWVITYATLFLLIIAASFGIFQRINVKNRTLTKKKMTIKKLYSRKDRYIIDCGQFEKGKIIYTFPGNNYSVKVIETSY